MLALAPLYLDARDTHATLCALAVSNALRLRAFGAIGNRRSARQTTPLRNLRLVRHGILQSFGYSKYNTAVNPTILRG